MNKYLLLRDNKQSGPYTVADLVAKGIKPYDLVWLEGKSAAWRYPSELDELKAYAPAVEEQPYDRFYKKPEVENEKNSSFQPVVAEKTTPVKTDGSSKKVYINFPGTQKRAAVQTVGTAAPAQSKELLPRETPAPVQKDNTVAPVIAQTAPMQATGNRSLENTFAYPATGKMDVPPAGGRISDKKLFYGVAVAFFALIMIISILIINYGNQRSSIKELNAMVQQMEKRQNEQNQSARAALASRVIPVPHEDPSDQYTDPALHNTNERSSANTPPVTPARSSVSSKTPPPSPPVSPQVNTPAPTPGVTASSKLVPKDQPRADARPASSSSDDKASAENLRDLVSVQPNKFRTGLFGGIVNLQFVLTNQSTRELRRVSVEIRYFSPEKKLVKTQTVYFENVAPNSQPVLDVPKTSRGVTIDYAITHIES